MTQHRSDFWLACHAPDRMPTTVWRQLARMRVKQIDLLGRTSALNPELPRTEMDARSR